MRVIKHTIGCPLPGYESLDLTFNVAMTGEEYDTARDEGDAAAGLVDFPNWTAVAESLELPRDKPAFPLTAATLNTLPFLLVRYLTGNSGVSDALDSYLALRSPNYRRS